jgi:hypothetical protein
MTRTIVMAFHKYTPFGGEFYNPILKFQLRNLQKYYTYPYHEFDKLYLVDSNWDIGDSIDPRDVPYTVLKVDPSLRYYDAYKEVLPQIKEDLVLFMDNDMVVYKPDIIASTFRQFRDIVDLDNNGEEIKGYDVVSIMDTIGTWKTDKLLLGNKFCPYWFATRKNLLMKYLGVDWSPDSMPDFETLGKLTKAMVEDGIKTWEMADDKTEVTNWNPLETGKTLGYYHIRAGSTIAYLLATKKYGNIKTYDDYIENQPHSEIVRHCQWYAYMGGNPTEIYNDL